MNLFWEGIAGHQTTLEQLKRLLDRNSTPHALLFSGPEAVGKKRVAHAFASAILTSSGKAEQASEKLRLLEVGNHPDLHICRKPEDKKEITVETVRELCSGIRLKPYYGNGRVSIIDNAHLMNIAASNALLMTLEEPCAESYLILVTHAAQRLPATIVSRCQTVHFGELHATEIEQVLHRQLQLEGNMLADVRKLCNGSFEALDLERFLSVDGLRVEDPKGAKAHLEDLVTRSKRVRADIERHLHAEPHPGEIASFATFLAAEVDESPIVWRLLHESLRNALRSAKRNDIQRLSQLLELSLTAEKLVRERNVNPQLQLTSLLLEQLR